MQYFTIEPEKSQQLTEVPGRPMQIALDALDRKMPQQTSLPVITPQTISIVKN